jgi:hypothetical protein
MGREGQKKGAAVENCPRMRPVLRALQGRFNFGSLTNLGLVEEVCSTWNDWHLEEVEN